MSGRVLLDTNIIIALFARDSAVENRLTSTDEVFVPTVALGELFFGAHKSSKVEENLQRIRDFAASNVVLTCNLETAHHYGRTKNTLREIGRPIPENDIWIAAIALQNQLTVVTRDAHFSEIPSLQLELW